MSGAPTALHGCDRREATSLRILPFIVSIFLLITRAHIGRVHILAWESLQNTPWCLSCVGRAPVVGHFEDELQIFTIIDTVSTGKRWWGFFLPSVG